MINKKYLKANSLLLFVVFVLTGCATLPIERFNPLPTLESNVEQPILISKNPNDLHADEGLTNL